MLHTQFKGKHFPLLHCLPKLGTKTLVYKTCPQLFQKGLGVTVPRRERQQCHTTFLIGDSTFGQWKASKISHPFSQRKNEFSNSSQNGVLLRIFIDPRKVGGNSCCYYYPSILGACLPVKLINFEVSILKNTMFQNILKDSLVSLAQNVSWKRVFFLEIFDI